MKRVLESAKKILQINTVSHLGTESLSGQAEELMKDCGMKVSSQHVLHSHEGISKRQFNVIGIMGDPLVDRKTKKGLLLSVPVDTQSPGVLSHWKETGGNPWALTNKGGKLYGLGAAHAKLDFLCRLAAIERFRERKLRQPVYLVATCGKELGLLGANYLIKSMALNPNYVLSSSPTNLNLVYRHKGQLLSKLAVGYQSTEKDVRGFNRKVDLRYIGRTSSGAYPNCGSNAILGILQFIKVLSESGFEFRIAVWEGGISTDAVPDESKLSLYLTAHQYEDFKRFFKEYQLNHDLEQQLLSDLTGANVVGVKFISEQALMCLLKLLDCVEEFGVEQSAIQDSNYKPDFTTLNISQMVQKPGAIEVYLDMRLLPSTEVDVMERNLLERVKSVTQSFAMLKVTLSRERAVPPLYASDKQEFLALCQDALALAHLNRTPTTSSLFSEASRFAQAGFEALAFGPGVDEGNSHCPDESVSITDLEKAVYFYERLVERVCL